MNHPDSDLAALPDADQRDHRYTSTACHHHLHQHCRRTCKFCGNYCRCSCHDADDAIEVDDATSANAPTTPTHPDSSVPDSRSAHDGQDPDATAGDRSSSHPVVETDSKDVRAGPDRRMPREWDVT